VARAFVHGGTRLVIELECGGYNYAVTLERHEGELFQGSWSCRDGGKVHTGAASARLYSSGSNYLLFGEWSEEEASYYWGAELCAVQHFPDEAVG
jgi:hypothetical protein